MSSFSSILASIGANSNQPANTPRPPPANKASPGSNDPTVSKPALANGQTSASLTRKDSNATTETPARQPRNESTPSHNKTAGNTQSATAKAQTHSSLSSKSQASTSAAGAQSQKPPPKGSYREILARAEAAKEKSAVFGQIRHKAVERKAKHERHKAQDAAKKAGTGQNLGSRTSQPPNRSSSAKNEPGPRMNMPQRPTYTGTMRPSSTQSVYKGTMKPSSSSSSYSSSAKTNPATSSSSKHGLARPSDNHITGARYRYAEKSSEEEEDYEDDESDMEATGFDELEEEEQQSLRAARKEDEEALRQENEHRRQKAEKRKKLEQLAAARRR